MKYHILCSLILLCSITNSVLCAEAYKISSEQEFVGDLNHLNDAVTQCNLNELDKFDFIMTLFEDDSFSNVITYKRNVRNMFKIIENNRNKESTNVKLTEILKELKNELQKVTNEYNKINYLQFLDNSFNLINNFINTFCDKDNNANAIVLLKALEKFVSLLENVDKLMSIIEDFFKAKGLNLMILNSKNFENEVKRLKELVDKLTKDLKKYMDFRQENYNYFNTVMIYRIIKLQTYFKNTNEEISTMSQDNFNNFTGLFKEDLLMTIFEFYEMLNDYYDKDLLLLVHVLDAYDNVWKFIINFIELIKSYKD